MSPLLHVQCCNSTRPQHTLQNTYNQFREETAETTAAMKVNKAAALDCTITDEALHCARHHSCLLV